MPDLPFVSIIIPTYNRADFLRITLDSFLGQSYPPERYEIIVSDNNSTDNTRAVIAAYCTKHSSIKTIFEGRQGVHYARNSAAKIAKGEILYYTDDDMIADRNLLREIVKVFEIDTMIGTVTGLVVGKFEDEPPTWVKKYLMNGWLSLTDKNKQEELTVSKVDCGVFSCHQAIKRDVFLKSGGFNPENTAGVWIGDGETGLNIKIKSLGYKFAYTSKSIIYHIIPRNRTTLKYLINRIGNQGFADSYTDYRKHKNRKKIIPLMVKRNTIGLAQTLVFTLAKIAMGKCSWHFIPADVMYYYKRNAYDLRLYTNEVFRKIVEINDWVNSEQVIVF